MAYPTTIDAPKTDSTPTQTVADFGHSAQHNLVAQGLISVQTKVGTNGSADPDSIDFKVSSIPSGEKAVSKSASSFTAARILKTTGADTVASTTVSVDANDDVSGLGLQQNTYLTGRNAANSADINLIKVNASDTATAGVAFDFPSITLTTALAPTDGGTGIDTYAKGDLVAGSGTNALSKLPVGSNGLVLAANSATSTGLAWTSAASLAGIKFGGTGADGALTISSGTTTVNVGGAAYYELNYSSISITGTGSLKFSNPNANGTVIVLKCSGDAVLTSSSVCIDASGMGGAGGTGATTTTNGTQAEGGNGSDGNSYGFLKTNFGGGTGGGTNPGAVGTFGYMAGITELKQIVGKYPKLFVGAGGGAGRASLTTGTTVTGGNAGNGGGCLIFEVAGAINFTTTNGISVAGANGSQGSITATLGAVGGGAGGSGGCAFVLYNVLTAFSGTVNVAGGTGANTIAVGGGTSLSGAGAGSATNAGTSGNASVGGTGGAGLSLSAVNTEF